MSIDPELYRRACELFHTARELSGAARDTFLSGHGNEPALLELTRALLANDVSMAAPAPMDFSAQAAFDLRHDEVVGNYRIDRPIGEGGMSVVYLANQTQPVRRRVALKVLRVGMDTRELLTRFQAERHILALMEHPHIARVLDAGALTNGRPYFVMEYVDGTPITRYCDQHRMSIERRLRLFAQLCRAVQHAHDRGIIHRDLKPTNILIAETDGSPAPKVIDFGVAKALGSAIGAGVTAGFTRHGDALGTPDYMSPEQAVSSELLDVRTDIYSLGAVLYELLVGRKLFESQEVSLDELRRKIATEDPRRPSARLAGLGPALEQSVADARAVTVRRLRAILRSDLDWIVMRAIEKDAARRYASAENLADDVERYLARKPVVARPPSLAYRTRNYLRRHRALVTAFAAILTTLALGLAATAWQAHKARERLDRIHEVSRQLVGRFYDLADQVGGMQTKKMLAELATVTLADIEREKRLTIDEHRQLADCYEALAQVQGDPYSSSVGDVLGGRQSLLIAYRHRAYAYAQDSTRTDITNEMAKVLLLRGLLHQGDPLVDEEALERRAIAMCERIRSHEPDTTAMALESMCYQLLAEMEYATARSDTTTVQLERARQLRERLLEMNPRELEYQRLAADIYKTISYVTEDDSLSLSLADRALAMNQRYCRARPFGWKGLMDLAYAHRNLGYALRRFGNYPGELREMQACLAIRERMAAADTLDYRVRHFVSDACHLVGAAFTDLGEVDSSLAYHRRGCSILEEMNTLQTPPLWIGYELGYSYEFLAEAYSAVGDSTTARRYHTLAINYVQPGDALGWLRVTRYSEEFAHFLDSIGDSAQATHQHARCFDAIVFGMGFQPGDHRPSLPVCQDIVAELCHIGDCVGQRDPDLSLSAARLAEQYSLCWLGPLHPLTARSLELEGALLAERGDLIASRRAYQELLAYQPEMVLFCRPTAREATQSLALLTNTRNPSSVQRNPSSCDGWNRKQAMLIKRNALWGHQPWPVVMPLSAK